MAAYNISELVSQLVNQFVGKQDKSKNLENETALKDSLTKDVYKCLYKRPNLWQIDVNVIKENYSVGESIKAIVRQLKSTENYATAEALSECLRKLSDDKEHIRENVQVCLRFLIALSKISEAENAGLKDSYLDFDIEEKSLHRGTVWYDDKFSSQPGVMHMYSNDIFELEDPFSNPMIHNYWFDTSHHGLELWTRGMYRDLQQMSSRSPGLEESHHLWYSNSDDSSQIGSEYGSWNTPSDEEGNMDFNFLSSIRGMEAAMDSNTSSFYTLLCESKNNNVEEELTDNYLKYQDSVFHLDAICDYFVEQQFREPAILVRAHDVIQLLIGLSSDSFYIVKSGRFLNVFNRDDEESSLSNSLLTKFVSMGLYVIRLREFLQEPSLSINNQGSVNVALKCGIAEYLLCYETTVSSTLLEDVEHIGVLNHHFEELGENLSCVAELCGFEDPNLEPTEMPIGTDFIDHLYNTTAAAGSGHMYSTLMFLIKHAFSPYFRFLQQWLFEGIYDDSLEEFRLQKNFFYEEAKDETYWTSCYTIPLKYSGQFSPIFLKEMDVDILVCGKSFNLLKRCCPTHLLFSVDLPPPSFELAFTEDTIRNVQKKCSLAMLLRIVCILENIEGRKLNLFDENLNQLDLPPAAIGEKLSLSLLKFKSQIEQTLENIFSEEKDNNCEAQAINKESKESDVSIGVPSVNFCERMLMDDITNSNVLINVRKSKSYECITEDISIFSTNVEQPRVRRKSWPLPSCTFNMEIKAIEIKTLVCDTFVKRNRSGQPFLSECNFEDAHPEPDRVATTVNSSCSPLFYSEISSSHTSKNEIITAAENQSGDKALDRLVKQLLKQLLGCDDKGDESQRLFHRQHLCSLINLSLHPIMKAQIDLVNKCILNYFFDVLEINNHFFALTNFFGLRDGEFGDSLCRQLYDMVDASKYSSDVFNAARLNSVLIEALANSVKGETVNSVCLSLQAENLAHTNPENMIDVLKFIKLNYEVQWPCNIIITELQLSTYNKILAFMLHIQHVMSILRDTWLYFKKLSVENPNLAVSSQFRTLQLYRHEMQHFVKAFKSYVGSEILDLAWGDFQVMILEQIKNLEDLRTAHSSYITTMLEVCLMNPDSKKVLKNLKEVLRNILRFHNILVHSVWQQNSNTRQWEHQSYSDLLKEFECYRRNSLVFYKVVVELCQLKYQTYLEHLLLTVDFNLYYKKTS